MTQHEAWEQQYEAWLQQQERAAWWRCFWEDMREAVLWGVGFAVWAFCLLCCVGWLIG